MTRQTSIKFPQGWANISDSEGLLAIPVLPLVFFLPRKYSPATKPSEAPTVQDSSGINTPTQIYILAPTDKTLLLPCQIMVQACQSRPRYPKHTWQARLSPFPQPDIYTLVVLSPSPSFPSSRCSWLGWGSSRASKKPRTCWWAPSPQSPSCRLSSSMGLATRASSPPGCLMHQGRRYLRGLGSTESISPWAWRWVCLCHSLSLKDGK